ncbi:hypothetical protein ASU85_24670 [Klebsiella aerogenes]|uniref:hypothetical protein n=1 Tax=Klebsiella aerogenes TaxID=548 RepID=UPI0007353912|nr:hypothetical protein [Klebsiella aerogenes]KTJ36779.1 hypothetical protein ASU85_24670 [Klebsiella aerogenes]
MSSMTDITRLLASLKRRSAHAKEFGDSITFVKLKDIDALVEALEKAQGMEAYWKTQCRGITDHCEELQARIAELESRTVTPVTYSENADADHCRKWAWEQVKGEVSTEGWTTGDNITYFGFFCWGWDMRRQYNEQRTVTVKLPKDHVDDADLFGWGVVVVPLEALKEACADAGVTVEIADAGIKWEAE